VAATSGRAMITVALARTSGRAMITVALASAPSAYPAAG